MMGHCQKCGTEVSSSGVGRPRKWCEVHKIEALRESNREAAKNHRRRKKLAKARYEETKEKERGRPSRQRKRALTDVPERLKNLEGWEETANWQGVFDQIAERVSLVYDKIWPVPPRTVQEILDGLYPDGEEEIDAGEELLEERLNLRAWIKRATGDNLVEFQEKLAQHIADHGELEGDIE